MTIKELMTKSGYLRKCRQCTNNDTDNGSKILYYCPLCKQLWKSYTKHQLTKFKTEAE